MSARFIASFLPCFRENIYIKFVVWRANAYRFCRVKMGVGENGDNKTDIRFVEQLFSRECLGFTLHSKTN